MKLPNSVHRSHPWRIHEIARDLDLLDVWTLPVQDDSRTCGKDSFLLRQEE